MGRILVLAGVNGAGKSSLLGMWLEEEGLTWFNPDTFTRRLVEAGWALGDANAAAWNEGARRLRQAIDEGSDFAFETTLGGNSIAALLHEASHSHDVLMWFCGLSSPEQHIARVQARVRSGGHPINEADIRRRWPLAQQNLVRLMPVLAQLQVYDNSADAAPGEAVPDPQLLLQMEDGQVLYPEADDLAQLAATPAWAAPLLEAALRL